MRPADPHQAVSDALQADVMRFMAIIAFCLIAILALVRSVEPAPPPVATPVVPPPVVPPPVAEEAAPPPTVAVPRPQPREPVVQPAPVPRPAFDPPADPVAQTPAEPTVQEAPATPASPAQRGLTLRFASDQDFMRLVSRGRVQVYAFDEGRVLQLDDSFRFAPAAAPGEVHELEPGTIPALMLDALQAVGDTASYHWGIAMPERMARQVREFVNGGASGELVIDRYGEVRLHDGA